MSVRSDGVAVRTRQAVGRGVTRRHAAARGGKMLVPAGMSAVKIPVMDRVGAERGGVSC